MIRDILRPVVRTRFVQNAFGAVARIREHGFGNYVQLNAYLLRAHTKSKFRKSRYRNLSHEEIKQSKKSETIFIFGSGYSLNDISAEEWRRIAMHDTMGFNHFVRQDWVRSDYHLIRGWREGVTDPEIAAEISEEFISLIDGKDEYRNTTFVVQHDFRAFFGNTLVGDGYFAKGTKIFQFKTLKESSSPDPNQPDYVCHGVGTLCDAISFAYCMEWKRIVLVGVDLYDSRYFWLRDDETIYTDYVTGKQEISAVTDRGQRFDEAHSTATAGILDLISRWNAEFQVNGVEIQVYNPKSLLSQVLSVYDGRHSDSRPQ